MGSNPTVPTISPPQARKSTGVARRPGRDYVRGTRIEFMGRLVFAFLSRGDPDGIAAREREISVALHATPCVHGIGGAWLTPSKCPQCMALIEASQAAARARMRATREAQFVREVREELGRREAVQRTRPSRGTSFDRPAG